MKAIVNLDGELFVNQIPNLMQDDYGFAVLFTIKNLDNTPFDLTDWIVTIKTRLLGAVDNTIDADCTNTDEPAGECEYVFQAADLDTIGVYDVELQFTNATIPSVRTISMGKLTVLEDLP